MSAIVKADGTVKKLDRNLQSDEIMTEESAKDPKRLSRYLLRLYRDISEFRRRFFPHYIDFQGVVSTGTDVAPMYLELRHGLNGPVVWWVARVEYIAGTGITLAYVREDGSGAPDDNVLKIWIYFPGRLVIRVQEAGG